ncbi:MAG: glutamate 5-kinase [Bdellovibrionales bacterium]
MVSSNTLVVKIGTAALSAEDGAPDPRILGALVGELAELKRQGHYVVLVSSGAVGTGRAMAKKDKLAGSNDPVTERQILASLGQARLMALYQDILAKHGILASQILLTKQDFKTRSHHKHMLHLFEALREQPRILPIVNENDCVTVEELMFTDNDELAGLLAAMIGAQRLVILSNIAGVYDRPPDQPGAKIIPSIDWNDKKALPSDVRGASHGGRGGMASKMNMVRKMSALGIRAHIANAKENAVLSRIVNGEPVGTAFAPLPRKRNAVKRWLASEVNQAPASVTANACLVDMLRDPHRALSLLPVGLEKVTGTFAKGDLVRIVDESGATLAIGIARYDSAALRQSLGKKRQPVFIHYDQLHRTECRDPFA